MQFWKSLVSKIGILACVVIVLSAAPRTERPLRRHLHYVEQGKGPLILTAISKVSIGTSSR